MFIKRVLSHGQREEIRVFLLEVLHIFQPFNPQLAVYPGHITRKVSIIRLRETGKLIACDQFFGEMKYCLEQIGKPVIFEQMGIFERASMNPFFCERKLCSSSNESARLSSR